MPNFEQFASLDQLEDYVAQLLRAADTSQIPSDLMRQYINGTVDRARGDIHPGFYPSSVRSGENVANPNYGRYLFLSDFIDQLDQYVQPEVYTTAQTSYVNIYGDNLRPAATPEQLREVIGEFGPDGRVNNTAALANPILTTPNLRLTDVERGITPVGEVPFASVEPSVSDQFGTVGRSLEDALSTPNRTDEQAGVPVNLDPSDQFNDAADALVAAQQAARAEAIQSSVEDRDRQLQALNLQQAQAEEARALDRRAARFDRAVAFRQGAPLSATRGNINSGFARQRRRTATTGFGFDDAQQDLALAQRIEDINLSRANVNASHLDRVAALDFNDDVEDAEQALADAFLEVFTGESPTDALPSDFLDDLSIIPRGTNG